jgi:SpoIID/LytB domain protein
MVRTAQPPLKPRRRPIRLAAALALGCTLACAPGCRAAPSAELHWPTQPPPETLRNSPVLWVGLASRLGPAPGTSAKAGPLVLRAASGSLELVDAKDRRLSGASLTLRWHDVALDPPLEIRRSVLGPFPSFESAEQAAKAWRALGVEPSIANPAEWEVWGPAGSPAPDGYASRQVEQTRGSRLELRAAGQAGEAPILLQGPLRITASGGLRWDGGVFQGPFRLQRNAYGTWTLIEEVPLERYLLGVVPHEIGAGSPPPALAAQTVLARTWALRNRQRYAVDGYHLCADTQCQVYADPRQAGSSVRAAVLATKGQVLSWQGEPIHAVYHASNGGVSAGFEEAWSGPPLPYLMSAPDGPAAFASQFPVPLPATQLPELLRRGGAAYGSSHPIFRWQRLLEANQVRQAMDRAGFSVGEPSRLKVLERGASGRVVALEVTGSGGVRVLRRDAIRRTLRQLPSTLFTLSTEAAGRWRFDGGGFGHGAGLSQAGAIDLGGRGWSLSRILQHYFPGAELKPVEALGQGL